MTGSIVTFDDAIPFMPIEKLVATIEPQQDLHGYANPWPAGGGKNILPMTVARLKLVNTDGTWNGNAYTLNGVTYSLIVDDGNNIEGISTNGTASAESDFFAGYNMVFPAGRYTSTGCPSGGSATTYRMFTSNMGADTGEGVSGTLDGVKTTNCRINIKSGTNVNGLLFKPMIRLESVTDATFAPYSNECPISGWTGLSGGVFDVNLLNQDGTNTSNGYVHGAYLNVYDGSVSSAAGTWDVMEYVPVKPNTTYTLSGTSVNSSNGWAEYDINKVQVAHGMASVSPFTFTTGARTHFVRFNRNYDTDTQCQINLGSSALPYVPYTSLPITCTWQTEAGTVYGGTVDVVTGVLTVDRAKLVLDENIPSGTNGFRNITVLTNGVRAEYYPYRAVGRANSVVLSDKFRYGSVSDGTPFVVGTSETNQRMYVNLPLEYDTEEKIRAWFTANPTTVVASIASPQTYQLSSQQISTLLGNNTVFVDTGDVSVTYQSTSGSTTVRTSFKSPLKSYSYSALKLFGNTFIEHGKG